MDLADFDRLATSFDGVRRVRREGRARWQLGGRLIARELESTHVIVRVPFEVRDALLRKHPEVFSVPPRFVRHMMVVAELPADDGLAVRAAVQAAWQLQTDSQPD